MTLRIRGGYFLTVFYAAFGDGIRVSTRRAKRLVSLWRMGMFDKVIKSFQAVVCNWDLIEIVIFIILAPWSLLYLAFRMLQEYET